MAHTETIRWPARFDPTNAPVHVRNAIDIAAPPEAIWAKLVAAPRWPEWYANARDVALEDGRSVLDGATRFKWTTFGFRLGTVVKEFEPRYRIAWQADGFGMSAYHAWLIVPRGAGSHVVTEESQHGWLARIGSLLALKRMWWWHQRWLEGLKAQVESRS